MAVPSSNTANLSLFKIAKELEFPDNLGYDNTMPYSVYRDSVNGATPVSLTNMSTGAGGFDAINSASSSKPNGSTPHSMSEFYSYDHDASALTQIGSTYSGNYSSSSWQTVSIDVSSFKGKTVRFVFHYVSGTNYTGDLQVDNLTFPRYYTLNETMGYFQGWGTTNNTFGTTSFVAASQTNNGGNWQTTTTDTSSYVGASWSTVAVGTSALRWNGRTGGTPSSSTGLSSGFGGGGYYVYAETSSPGYSNKNFWLRSGTHDIPNYAGTPYFGFRLGRYGATIGTLKVYIEEI